MAQGRFALAIGILATAACGTLLDTSNDAPAPTAVDAGSDGSAVVTSEGGVVTGDGGDAAIRAACTVKEPFLLESDGTNEVFNPSKNGWDAVTVRVLREPNDSAATFARFEPGDSGPFLLRTIDPSCPARTIAARLRFSQIQTPSRVVLSIEVASGDTVAPLHLTKETEGLSMTIAAQPGTFWKTSSASWASIKVELDPNGYVTTTIDGSPADTKPLPPGSAWRLATMAIGLVVDTTPAQGSYVDVDDIEIR